MYSSSLRVFWTENKHRFVSVLIILDDCQCGEGLTETYAVCQNAAIVFFEFADDGKHSVALKVVKHSPYFAFLESSSYVR